MQWSDRIGRRLKLRDLHILLAVEQWGSISKAAEHLAISHPVVSKAIADLEHTLGVRLFDRSSKGIEPTMYGRAFLASSRAVFDELRQGVERIEFLTDPTRGELRIGSTEPMAAGLTLAVLDRLAAQHPGAVFHVVEADAVILRRELRERNVELVVGRFAQPLRDDDLDVKLLFDERQQIVAGVENPWAGRRNIALAELLDEAWILPPLEGMAGSQIREAFLASGVEVPRPRLVTYSILLRISLLATGRFLTVFPSSMLNFSTVQSLFTVLPVELPASPKPAGIVALKGRTVSPLAELFITCAREMVQPMAAETKRSSPPRPLPTNRQALNLPIMPQRLQEPCGGRKAVRGFASDTIAAFDAVTAEARECKIFVAVLGVELHLRGSPFQ